MPSNERKCSLPSMLKQLVDRKGKLIPPLTIRPEDIYRWNMALTQIIVGCGDEYAAVLLGYFPETIEDVQADPENDVKASQGSASLEAEGRLIIRKREAMEFVNCDEVSIQHAPDDNGDRRTTKTHSISPKKLVQMLHGINRKLFLLVFGESAVGTIITQAVRHIVMQFDFTIAENRAREKGIARSQVFMRAMKELASRVDQTCVKNQKRLGALHGRTEMRHGQTIDIALGEFTSLYAEMKAAGVPVTEAQRVFDLENNLLPRWNKIVESVQDVNPGHDSTKIWAALVLKQTRECQSTDAKDSTQSHGSTNNPLAQGERGLHVTPPAPTGSATNLGSAAVGSALGAWDAPHGELLKSFASTVSAPDSYMRRWFNNPTREISPCYHPDCNRAGYIADLCDGPHNAPLRTISDVKQRLRTCGRDNNCDIIDRHQRSSYNNRSGGSSERGQDHRRHRDHAPRERRRDDSRAPRPAHRSQSRNNTQRRRGDHYREERRNDGYRRQQRGDGGRRNDRSPRSPHRGEGRRSAFSLQDPGYPVQTQHAFCSVAMPTPAPAKPLTKEAPNPSKREAKHPDSSNGSFFRSIAMHKPAPAKPPTKEAPIPSKREAKCTDSGESDDDDVALKRLTKSKPVRPTPKQATAQKKGRDASPLGKRKKASKGAPTKRSAKKSRGARSSTPSPIRQARCKCGFVGIRHLYNVHVLTCVAAPDYKGKKEAMVASALKIEKERRLRNMKQRLARLQKKIAAASAPALLTAPKAPAAASPNAPAGPKAPAAASPNAPAAASPAVPPPPPIKMAHTGGKGMWGFTGGKGVWGPSGCTLSFDPPAIPNSAQTVPTSASASAQESQDEDVAACIDNYDESSNDNRSQERGAAPGYTSPSTPLPTETDTSSSESDFSRQQ